MEIFDFDRLFSVDSYCSFFFKFHKNEDNPKLKSWSFRLGKNDYCRIYNERARALQNSIPLPFFIHPVYPCMFCILQARFIVLCVNAGNLNIIDGILLDVCRTCYVY